MSLNSPLLHAQFAIGIAATVIDLANQNLSYQKAFSVTELSAKQQKAIVLLAAGDLKKDTAKAVGVTPQTMSQWLRNLEFQACLNALKMEQIESARTSLQAMAKEATQSLAEVMRKADSYETRRDAVLRWTY